MRTAEPTGRLTSRPEDEVSPPRHQKGKRGKDNVDLQYSVESKRQIRGTPNANLTDFDTHENNDWRIKRHVIGLADRDIHIRHRQEAHPE
ncbi:hypothetical protein Tco_0327990 [Tanacetum coccineum]